MQGTSSACVFRHTEREIAVSVHGDDFTCSGPRTQLQWFEQALRERYELTVGARLGPGKDDDKEGLVLIEWSGGRIGASSTRRTLGKLSD